LDGTARSADETATRDNHVDALERTALPPSVYQFGLPWDHLSLPAMNTISEPQPANGETPWVASGGVSFPATLSDSRISQKISGILYFFLHGP
jgi:hypothetical protein